MNPTHWGELVKQIHKRNCVPFLGAGVNVSTKEYSGLPLAKDVTVKLVEDLTGLKVGSLDELGEVKANPVLKKLLEEFDDLGRLKVQDLGRVAFHTLARRKQKSFIELLQEILPDRKCRPSKLLATLARLPVPMIVTTNYDRLMEQALREAPLLRPSPPRDPVALTQQLMKVDDPLAAYFRQRFSSYALELLEKSQATVHQNAVEQAVECEMARLLDDVKDPSGLAAKLGRGNDSLSSYLRDQFSSPTRRLLDAYQAPDPPSADLTNALVVDLNRVLEQDYHLHEREEFSALDLPRWARRMMRLGPQGDALLRLNRLLLETIYAQEIAGIQVGPFEVVVQPLEGFVGAQQEILKNKLADHDGVVLYKIHGSFLDEEPPEGFPSVVITEEDYIQFLTLVGRKDGSIPELVTGKLASSNLLFLGYGLEDWDFRTLYKGLISNVPRNKMRESFAIQHNPPDYWVRFWEDHIFIYNMDIYEFADELEQRCRAYDQ